MSNELKAVDRIDLPPGEFLNTIGQVFAEFGAQSQDSGNISYGVQIGTERYFVKTAGLPEDPKPFLSHSQRVELLRNAIRLHASCRHPALVPLEHLIESPVGPLLVYPWTEGELLGTPRARRNDPDSSFQRFRSLPAPVIQRCLDAVYDLHCQLTRAGWISGDFYDGCLLFDFATEKLAVMDLDYYHQGPYRNEMGRMFGSTRFMAPEEFEKGALIDEQTTVFVMGRTALVFLSDGTLDPDTFRGSPALFEVVARACNPERSRRFASMSAFYQAWQMTIVS